MYYNKYLKYKNKYLQLKYIDYNIPDDVDAIDDIAKIKSLFPILNDVTKYNQLKIDLPSTTYISRVYDAEKITSIIIKNMKNIGLTPENSIITDATAGTGGNVLSFASKFKKVYGIEMDSKRAKFLQNNVQVFGFTNVVVINGDSIEEVKNIKDHDVICIDPPWGGSDYKKHKYLQLYMSDTHLEDMCLDIFNEKKMAKVPSIICLKLPLNYDTRYLYSRLKQYKIVFYKLKKMLIVIIFNKM